ncbi:FeoC-like transcriptional regulator [[Phormidium] sp. ETS-05]|uniref:FeoC-like transcriptional regulator n=1 Tax=[Phormidium] sp. ETS-05 TaxID=222819 RepID=UPI0018EF21E0|nr:FeoC-like transcriptional regulator [[Phormidium] sp. ETS-05]
MLQDIQNYLRDRPVTSLAELAQHFQVDTDALRFMLERLIRKGRVRQLESKKCGGCHTCATESLELYQWVNSTPAPCHSPSITDC